MTITELVNSPNYYRHHTASRREYISRKIDGVVRPYAGRFGTGYIVLRPRFDSTTFCYVDYYIVEEN